MITDLFMATIPQMNTLRVMGDACFTDVANYRHPDISARVYLGPGYICYVICLWAALLRALFHWLTPIPGKGQTFSRHFFKCLRGCLPSLPESLRKALDPHGDGKVSYKELKEAYKTFRAQQKRKTKSKAQHEKEWKVGKQQGSSLKEVRAKFAAIQAPSDLGQSDRRHGRLVDRIVVKAINNLEAGKSLDRQHFKVRAPPSSTSHPREH